jgi:MFS family permease
LAGIIGSMREVLKGNVLILTLGTVMRQLSLFMTFPFFSLYVRALGGSMVDIGVVNAFRPLAAMFIYPIAGVFAGKYNRMKILVYTGLLNAVLYGVYMLAPDWRYLAVANFLNGILVFRFPASSSLLADSMNPRLRGSGFAAISALPGFVGVITPFIGGYLMTVFDIEVGMKILYGWTIIVMLLISALNWRYIKEPRTNQSHTSLKIGQTIKTAYRDIWETMKWMPRNLRYYAVMITLNLFFTALTGPFWVVYATEVIGISELDWGSILTTATLIQVVLSILAGNIVDKMEKRKVAAAALAFAVVPILAFPYCTSLDMLYLIFVPIAASNAFLLPVAGALMADLAPQERRGMVMAALGRGSLLNNYRGGGGGGPAMGFVLTVPVIMGSILGGYLYDYSPVITWTILGCSVLVNAFIAFALLKTSPSEGVRSV